MESCEVFLLIYLRTWLVALHTKINSVLQLCIVVATSWKIYLASHEYLTARFVSQCGLLTVAIIYFI